MANLAIRFLLPLSSPSANQRLSSPRLATPRQGLVRITVDDSQMSPAPGSSSHPMVLGHGVQEGMAVLPGQALITRDDRVCSFWGVATRILYGISCLSSD